jgi:hypothetical protein
MRERSVFPRALAAHFSQADGLAVVALISLAMWIFSNSYLSSMNLSPDGMTYLRIARSLMDGQGLRLNSAAGDAVYYMTMWPAGYPALIAVVAVLTGANVMLASKLIAFILSICILLFFRRRQPVIYGMVALLMLSQGYVKCITTAAVNLTPRATVS